MDTGAGLHVVLLSHTESHVMNALTKIAAGGALMLMLSATALMADTNAIPAATPITPTQAMAAQGQNVTVEGVASLSDANGMPPGMFIRLGAGGRDAPFAGYISADNQGKFPGLGTLRGRMVAITGVVETTTTIPIIRISSPDQIRIVR
jgi:hypothetical protein